MGLDLARSSLPPPFYSGELQSMKRIIAYGVARGHPGIPDQGQDEGVVVVLELVGRGGGRGGGAEAGRVVVLGVLLVLT